MPVISRISDGQPIAGTADIMRSIGGIAGATGQPRFGGHGGHGHGHGHGGHGGHGGGLVPSKPGPSEILLQQLFAGLLSPGGPGAQFGPLAQTLFASGQGIAPEALQRQFQQNLAQSQAAIRESFGRGGARFGTDLTRTLAEQGGQANVNFQAALQQRALEAIAQVLGIGTGQAGLQFARQESALDRALQEFLQNQQNDPTQALLQAFLAGGI